MRERQKNHEKQLNLWQIKPKIPKLGFEKEMEYLKNLSDEDWFRLFGIEEGSKS